MDSKKILKLVELSLTISAEQQADDFDRLLCIRDYLEYRIARDEA